MKKIIAGILFVGVLAGVFLFFGIGRDEPKEEQQEEVEVDPEQSEKKDPVLEEPPEFNQEIAKNVMEQYKQLFTTIMDSAEDDGVITGFNSRTEVQAHLMKGMSESLASSLMERYIGEKEGRPYLIPTSAPVWLENDLPFQIERISDEHYKIVQEKENELIGHAVVTYHVKPRDAKWIVSQVDTKMLGLSIEQLALMIVDGLKNQDMNRIADYVYPQKGLLFSPYVYIEDEAIVFQKEEVSSLLENNSQYLWGYYDGSGDPIELTPKQYLEEILYAKPYENADEILVDDIQQRGNTINNVKEVFPQSKVVEYYLSGSEKYGGMDWASLLLVFEQDESGEWLLVAMVNDKWTI
ncbi:hypothetical protein [Bacillus dakarensis]|uniref:hypothetical protein n=1 Tax=Robertmurraya dakarensis TaxID=1926278 RepID=UPI000982003C|nr:hypothetical protein [Bacillus dakarensis]